MVDSDSTSSHSTSLFSENSTDTDLIRGIAQARSKLHDAISSRVVGQEEVIDLMLITLFARGHALLVGVPGLAKTLLVSTLAEALDLSFGRVQFTPDLLPADITGTDVLKESSDGHNTMRAVAFEPGPIFHHLVLADEINRTPPKTQAALLQAMQERQVTVGSRTHILPKPFQVFATRNPIEQEGTYPLPEAQLDRFLLEIHLDYPSESDEREIAFKTTAETASAVPSVLSQQDLLRLQNLILRVPITDEALRLAVKLTRATRPKRPQTVASSVDKNDLMVEQYVRFGAGPRGSQSLVIAAKARAALKGAAAADIEDVLALFIPVMRHRMVLSYRAEAENMNDTHILSELLSQIK